MPDRRRGCKVIQVIECTTLQGEGDGHQDIYRDVVTYYSLDGRLLATHDPCPDGKE